MNYQEINAKAIDRWVEEGWEWGVPIDHETYEKAKNGDWNVLLTPTVPVPHDWFGPLRGKKVLGLASGGGQQMPIFAAIGADCTVLDYSDAQLESERLVSEREGYPIAIVKADMTKPLPFSDASFDLIFHPVSNCYVHEVKPIFKECFRVLKPGGALLSGLDNGINFLFDGEDETTVVNSLPFDPLKNPEQMEQLMRGDLAVEFSHTAEEQIGGQLEAGFILTHLYEDTNGEGRLHELHIPSFFATRARKPGIDEACIAAFWRDVLDQDREALPKWFTPDAEVFWHCTNERFTADEFIRVNCAYPGAWDGEIERIEPTANGFVTAVRVFSRTGETVCRVTSFFTLQNDRIKRLDEYWADDGPAPDWRKSMRIGRPIR
jgi:SAM-dependent methyltransferase